VVQKKVHVKWISTKIYTRWNINVDNRVKRVEQEICRTESERNSKRHFREDFEAGTGNNLPDP
jgi:hypothetical protein